MLQFAALYLVCLFVWDDHMEDMGQLGNDNKLDRCCLRSIEYTRWALGLSKNEAPPTTENLPSAIVLLNDIMPILGKRLDQGISFIPLSSSSFISQAEIIKPPQTAKRNFSRDLRYTCCKFVFNNKMRGINMCPHQTSISIPDLEHSQLISTLYALSRCCVSETRNKLAHGLYPLGILLGRACQNGLFLVQRCNG
jgi:hypothetical protein